MNNESLTLKEILEARETRARTQRALINTFRTTLVSFTLNIPGVEKNNTIFFEVHEMGIRLLEEELKKNNIKLVIDGMNFWDKKAFEKAGIRYKGIGR